MTPNDDDLREEIRGHLAISEKERRDRGDAPDAARLAARKEFGNLTLTRDAMRAVWRRAWLDAAGDILQDVRYAVRLLRRSPAFSLVVVLVLAIGTAANATVFGLVKNTLLRPLPGVPDAADLVTVVSRAPNGAAWPLTYPDYEYLRGRDTGLASVSASAMVAFSVGAGSRGERVWGEFVSPSYFDTLGATVRLGRPIGAADDGQSGQPAVAVISEGLWQRMFGAAPDIVGRTITVNAHTLTIVGVSSGGFHGSVVGLILDLFVPAAMQPALAPPDEIHRRDSAEFFVLGHPRQGVSRAGVAARMKVLSAELDAEAPMAGIPTRAEAIPLSRSPFGAQTYVLPLAALLGAMGTLLLVVVSANLSNLVLARGVARRGEMAVRRALGASSARVFRLLFVESVGLALPGAATGLLLSRLVGVATESRNVAFAAMAPTGFNMAIGPLDVGFALVLSLVSALLFGFLPALRSARVSPAAVIKEEGHVDSGRKSRLRAALVVSQVAVAALLLVGAALAVRTLAVARRVDGGFDPSGVVSVNVDLQPNGYDEARGHEFYDRVLESLRAAPGVDAASLANAVPLNLVPGGSRRIAVDGYQPRVDENMIVAFTVVDRDYFRTLNIPLVAGREFEARDTADAPGAVVVDATLARRFWGGSDAAVGRRIRASGTWWTVVGVARDVKHTTITERPAGHVYYPFAQQYRSDMTIHVRSASVPADALIQRVRDTVASIDPALPILSAHTLSDQSQVGLFAYVAASSMLLVTGLMAIALAALGIYGLLAYTVKQSTREIGIRLALGARRADVIGLFLRRGLRLGALGLVVGLGLAAAVARVASSFLIGVSPLDLVSFGGAFVAVLAIVAAASFLPSWRAARTSPIAALRRL